MKILVVVPNSHFGGGVNASAMNFCNIMSKEHEVYFLDMSSKNLCTFALDGNTIIAEMSRGSKNWNITQEQMQGARGFKKLKLCALGMVKKLTVKSGLWYRISLKKFKEYGEFDIAIAFRQCDPCYSFVLNKVKAKKKIAFVHGEPQFMGDISSWKKYMPKYHKIAYVSNAVEKKFVEMYPELAGNACTVYNMFNVEQIESKAQMAPDVEFDKSIKNIVTVARIDNEYKQTEWIVEICKRLKEGNAPRFHWYVLGDGPDYEKTVKLAKEMGVDDVLTFTGNQKNPYAIVKNADFTVLTSKSEAYPMVVIESLILKKAMVVAKFPSIVEMMESGVNGIIAEQSIDSVYENVLKLLNNDNGILDTINENLSKLTVTNEKACKQFEEATR